MVKCISPKKGVSVNTVSIKNNPMQNVVMTFELDWVAIYLYSLTRGIVVARLISMEFGSDKFRL